MLSCVLPWALTQQSAAANNNPTIQGASGQAVHCRFAATERKVEPRLLPNSYQVTTFPEMGMFWFIVRSLTLDHAVENSLLKMLFK